jgi:hypothetical protein
MIEGDDELSLDSLTADQVGRLLSASANMGRHTERWLIIKWLRRNAADFLFAQGLDLELQEYGTTVLEMVAEALEEKEHWQHTANMTQETIQ